MGREQETARDGGRFRTQLRWRTALAGVAVFLVPFGSFYLLAGYGTERYLLRQTSDRLQAGVATNVRLLDDVLALRAAEAEGMAQTLTRSSLPEDNWLPLLETFVQTNPWYEHLVVADGRGQIVTATGKIHGQVPDIESLRRARAGETALSNVFVAPWTGEAEIVIATPIRRPRGEALVLLAALKREKLQSRLLDLGAGDSEDVFLVDAAGQLATTPRLDGQALTPYQDAAGVREHRDYRGQEVVCAYQRLARDNYYLVAHVDRSEVLARAHALRRSILLYLSPFLVLGVALAIATWHFGLNTIEKLTAQLYQALGMAEQRGRERDLAHEALARRFEEERELARQKAQFQTQLAEYEKYAALSQLALGAAHEINNPLLGILSHLELELRVAREAADRAEVEQCIEACKRIAAAVRGLLNYARPEPLQLREVILQHVVENTLAFLSHQPLFHGKRLEKDIPADLPAIQADGNQLSQVLMNLLLNSADATPEGGTITLRARYLDSVEKVEIQVADTGCGVPPDILPHVFEPFFTTKRAQGTGLGLSISQTYVRSHHGDIRLESTPKQGTVVTITLPVRQEEPKEEVATKVVA